MSLSTYNKKRNFGKTSEPAGKKDTGKHFRFVVQRHQASSCTMISGWNWEVY